MRSTSAGIICVALVGLFCLHAQAATMSFSVVQPSAGQWQVYGSLGGVADNDGLASVILDVTGWGNLSITSSQLRLPYGTHYWLNGSQVQSEVVGFSEYRNDGVSGVGIRAGQRTVTAGNVVLEDVGFLAGTTPGDTTGQGLGPATINWSAPVLIASGTYTGSWGKVKVNVGDGQINVLDQNRPAGTTGLVHQVESVIPGQWSLLHGGDANGDWAVNVGDLGILAGNWGLSGRTWANADFTGDGLVNVGDLGVLAGAWGWSTPTGGTLAAVPAPAAIWPMAVGLLGIISRRRARAA